MYLPTQSTRTCVSLSSLAFCVILVMALVGRGSVGDTRQITDDSGFRRAMLQSSSVFAFETTDVAITHWARLWNCSNQLDHRTHDARQSLLIHAVGPLIEQATSESLEPIKEIRDLLESEMTHHAEKGSAGTREICDWIVLNKLLGDNQRTLQWMARYEKTTDARPLPRRVRDLVRAELGETITRDRRGRMLTTTS